MILLTGATGYVGGRLLRRLEAAGRRVRCLARRPELLAPRVGPHTTVVAGDLASPAHAPAPDAFTGVTTAFYLVHTMAAGEGFAEADRRAARAFAAAARAAGVRHIIYLGGLGDERERLSDHLQSRHEVGRLLREAGCPVTEFRAGAVLGSGSLSFELVRALVERLPVMVTPRWVRVPTQPIFIEDLLDYLMAALAGPPAAHEVVEIGGPDALPYAGLMHEYARLRGLRRYMIPVPVLTPRLSGLWLGLVTPVYARVGRALVDSTRHPTVVLNPAPARRFGLTPVGVREALARALRHEDNHFALTRWCDAVSSNALASDWGGARLGTRLVDARQMVVQAPAAQAFRPVRTIGGQNGWYAGRFLWRLRGYLDLLVGGVGLRRGRRDPETLRVGDALDFWRVERYEPDRLLRLSAEMRLPGRAWLQFEADERTPGRTTLTQTALFDPSGLAGLAYWYALYPLHCVIFARMLREIARRGEAGTPGL